MSTDPLASLRRTVLRDPVHWLPFGFGAGLLPVAPGTWGSLLALAGWWLVPPLPTGLVWLGCAAGFVLGCLLCGVSSRRLGVHDHGGIVWDEMIAMWLVLSVTPRSSGLMWLAFLAFRFFDVAKPWPIREADHSLRGGLGIMLDDVLAAVYAALVVRGVMLLPLF